MSLIAPAFRMHWMPGIHEVTGPPGAGVPAWLAAGSFQVYSPVSKDAASLTLSDGKSAAAAFAADFGRFATAAIETLVGIERSSQLPKSSAWLAIRSYYAGFFAAHAILRVLGVSCTQLDHAQTTHISDIADIYGMRPGPDLAGGLYACTFAPGALAAGTFPTLHLQRIDSGGGSHVATWKTLLRELRKVSTGAASSGLPVGDAQLVTAKLTELEYSLTDHGGLAAGGWLSTVRNRVNYRLELGAWFPYGERKAYYDQLYGAVTKWRTDPMTVTIWAKQGRELQRLVDTSVALVSVARVLAEDLTARCPAGRSMQRYSCMQMMNQLAA